MKEYSSKSYKENPEAKRIKARECSQKNYIKNADSKKSKALEQGIKEVSYQSKCIIVFVKR